MVERLGVMKDSDRFETEYEGWARVEEVFLEKVEDDEIRKLYLHAKAGDKSAFLALVNIAYNASPDYPSPFLERSAQADRAIEILFWLRNSAQ
jgi:hypothetical protein